MLFQSKFMIFTSLKNKCGRFPHDSCGPHLTYRFGMTFRCPTCPGIKKKNARSSGVIIWVCPKIWENPPNHPFVHMVFHYKPSILGENPLFLEETPKIYQPKPMHYNKGNKSLKITIDLNQVW